ncbi:MAG: TMEM165/GDT1 family protein [Coriobacteriia bacterium]|nr:TMEM165/GDT1 family protein [Coriobacteriia bacterium]
MVEALVIAAVLVAVAELGDKTQMLTLLLASRYPGRQVFAGVLIAVLGLQLMATVAGRVVGDLIPERVLALVTAGLFIGFGIWSLRDALRGEEEDDLGVRRAGWGPVAAVAGAFFIAEFGDKTQVLTLAVAADPGAAARALAPLGIEISVPSGGLGVFLGVWIGSTLGMMLVNGAAIWAGGAISRRLPQPVVARISGVLFIVFGLFALAASYFG